MARLPKPNRAPKLDIDIAIEAVDPSDSGIVNFRARMLRELQQMSDKLVRMTTEVDRLNILLRKYRSPLYMISQTDIVVVEIFLSLASIWAAITLWRHPMLFESFPSAFRSIKALEPDESIWGAFAFVAGATKIGGLVASMTSGVRWGRIVRYVGLAMSGLFWSLMGGGVLLSNPNTLFGFNSLLMGLFSWWSLLRLVK